MTRLIVAVVVPVVLWLTLPIRADQPTARPTVFTEAQAAAGKAAYQSVCFNCHTESLGGRNGDEANELPLLSSLPEDWQKMVRTAGGKVPPLAGPKFMAKWATKTTQAFSSRVDTAIGGFRPTPMDETTYLNLTAYFLHMNGAQPGPEPLTSETAVVIQTIVPQGN